MQAWWQGYFRPANKALTIALHDEVINKLSHVAEIVTWEVDQIHLKLEMASFLFNTKEPVDFSIIAQSEENTEFALAPHTFAKFW